MGPSEGRVAMLSLTARRNELGGGGSWGSVAVAVLSVYFLYPWCLLGFWRLELTSVYELVQGAPLGPDEDLTSRIAGGSAAQEQAEEPPAIEGHVDARCCEYATQRSWEGEFSHLRIVWLVRRFFGG